MLKSYFITACRHLLRQKLYAAINISGLAVGLACAALLLIYAENQLSYDAVFARSEGIYRVATQKSVAQDPRLKTLLEAHFPEALAVARIRRPYYPLLGHRSSGWRGSPTVPNSLGRPLY